MFAIPRHSIFLLLLVTLTMANATFACGGFEDKFAGIKWHSDSMEMASARGTISFLRATEQPDQWGSTGTLKQIPTIHGRRYWTHDAISAEVVIKLEEKPGYAFGFRLREDECEPSAQAMFDLLRDAFRNKWTISIDYWKPRDIPDQDYTPIDNPELTDYFPGFQYKNGYLERVYINAQ